MAGCGSLVNLIQLLAAVGSSQVLCENVADNCQLVKVVPRHGLARFLQNVLTGLMPSSPVLGGNVLALPRNSFLMGYGSPVNLIQPLAAVGSSQVLCENVVDNCQVLQNLAASCHSGELGYQLPILENPLILE
ncbi:hypothetical protein SELMODRAFT_418133 [Selaginella moellendorffii]|uniref:Secreted protein n=1 Tax=Selaginella moellendorffii TaxID=88036 RepID=D8S4S7_SELML|nr:hypothetical protein SELMODRAFT_418133 [Selaginella moellendorffii]